MANPPSFPTRHFPSLPRPLQNRSSELAILSELAWLAPRMPVLKKPFLTVKRAFGESFGNNIRSEAKSASSKASLISPVRCKSKKFLL